MIDGVDNYETVLYNSKDIKNIFKCGVSQAYEILHTNGFPSVQIGGTFYVEKKALENWLQKNQGKHVIT